MTKRIYPHPHDRLGAGANTDPKISLMRRTSSQGNSKYNIAGNLKTGGHASRPITLPKLTFTEPKD